MKYSDIINEKSLMTLRDNAFDAMREYAKHINDTVDTAEVTRLEKVCTDRIAEYTKQAKNHTFDLWLTDANPIQAALADAVYPTLSLKKKGKTGARTCDMSDDTKVFALDDFIGHAVLSGKNIVTSNAWLARLEEAHKTLCGFLVTEMHSEGLKAKFLNEFDCDFTMKVGNADCGEAEFKKRYTKGAIDRTLQALFDALLFVDETGGGKNKYTVKNANRNAILYTYARMNPKVVGDILFKNTGKFTEDITKEFAVIVRNGEHSFSGYPMSSK